MEPVTNNEKMIAARGLKQVKVDNWSTFFLQRLLQLYFNEELLDLSIKFHTCDNVLKVHRLVVTTCTDYFLQLEQEQNESTSRTSNVIFMPSDMPYQCVKSIISFMYTGQLEYWASEQRELYDTAQKMNMSVLTKLLDAQLNSNDSRNLQLQKAHDLTSSLTKISSEHMTNKQPARILSDKKELSWKRKLDDNSTLLLTNRSLNSIHSNTDRVTVSENTSVPSRFDLPEIEELTLGVFSSFDDITYNTKPIVQAPEKVRNKIKKIDITNDDLTDIFVAYDESENCVSIDNNKNDHSDDDEWIGLENILKFDDWHNSPKKKGRFEFIEKENISKFEKNITSNSGFVDKHAKIIREVLKKYPHLVQHNKNIRLKIMQKECKNSEISGSGKTKVSYVELTSDSLMINHSDNVEFSKNRSTSCLENTNAGPWKCIKCNLEEQYTNYYMFRRHAEDVHGEKFDPRICEHCGYKATKRNILLYHLYTKHNIFPPKNIIFPKCEMCSYIALTETLLIKHQINHKHKPSTLRLRHFTAESITCNQCSLNFTDVTDLAYHEITSGHGSSCNFKVMGHSCLYCDKSFINLNHLKDHISTHHREPKNFILPKKISTPLEISLNHETDNSNVFINSDIEKNQYSKVCNKLLNCEKKGNETDVNNYLQSMVDSDLTVENMVVHNSENMILPMHNTGNDTSEFNSSSTFKNCRCLHNNDGIIEVVGELKSVEQQKYNCEINENKQNIRCFSSNIEMNEDKSKNFSKSPKKYCKVNQLTDIIQYIEEETEILEYETSTNV